MEKYETFGPRFLASIIDGVIFIPLSIVNWLVISADPPLTVLYFWFLIMHLANPLYTVLMHGFYGQTLGKMAAKVKVVDLFENPITLQHAVLRSLPQIILSSSLLFAAMSQTSAVKETAYFSVSSIAGVISVFGMIWSIGDIISFLVTDKRRALHDFIAGTVVIKVKS